MGPEESPGQKWRNLKTGNEESRQAVGGPSGLFWGCLELKEWKEQQEERLGRQCYRGWRPGSAPHLSEPQWKRKNDDGDDDDDHNKNSSSSIGRPRVHSH